LDLTGNCKRLTDHFFSFASEKRSLSPTTRSWRRYLRLVLETEVKVSCGSNFFAGLLSGRGLGDLVGSLRLEQLENFVAYRLLGQSLPLQVGDGLGREVVGVVGRKLEGELLEIVLHSVVDVAEKVARDEFLRAHLLLLDFGLVENFCAATVAQATCLQLNF